MGQVIQFPTGAAQPAPSVIATKGAANAAPVFPVVRSIRPHGRIPRKNHQRDEGAILIAKMVQSFREKAEAAANDPTSAEYRVSIGMTAVASKLPVKNLRCICSTLDERKDFDLRCVEVEIAQARHQLASREADRVGVIEGEAWWQSATQSPMVNESNRLFDIYRDAVMQMAETPARTWIQFERKARLIGKCWLSAKGDWYDRLRTAIEADRAWLEANCPKKRRAR